MNFNIVRLSSVTILGLALSVNNPGMAYGGEHPEHPTKSKKEHPEHPEKSVKKSSLTKEQLATAIEDYVKKESADQGGYFTIDDEKTDKTLELTLLKVHKERLSMVAPQTYFACADFKEKGGKEYDLDIFMKGSDKDKLTVTEVSIHKEDGKERYHWHEDKGIWKKHSVVSKKKKEGSSTREHPEHPEHPK